MHVTERLVRGLIQTSGFKNNRRGAMPGKKQEQRLDLLPIPGCTCMKQCVLHTHCS